MRSLIHELRPSTVEETGLIPALRQHTDALQKWNALAVDFEVSDKGTITAIQADNLFRIAHEALNNVTKHAQTDQAVVALAVDDDRISLYVTDEGIGFDLAQVEAEHDGLGLSNMKERAELIGGTFTLTSGPQSGTRVLVEVHRANGSAGYG